MSCDMFVFSVSDAPSDRFPRVLVERAFAPYVKDPEEDDWCLYLDGEQIWATMFVDSGELIQGFSVNRPPGYEGFRGFWDALYEVMRQTRTTCFIAGIGEDAKWCAANPDLRNRLPEDFVEKFGELNFASSAAELAAAAWGD